MDGTGRLDLWNLNKDTEVASASVVVEGGAALNRVTWTQSGLHVAAGDDQGKIWVYDVGEQLAVPQPDEWNKFAHTLQVNSDGCFNVNDFVRQISPMYYTHTLNDVNDTISAILFQDLRKYHIDFCESDNNF